MKNTNSSMGGITGNLAVNWWKKGHIKVINRAGNRTFTKTVNWLISAGLWDTSSQSSSRATSTSPLTPLHACVTREPTTSYTTNTHVLDINARLWMNVGVLQCWRRRRGSYLPTVGVKGSEGLFVHVTSERHHTAVWRTQESLSESQNGWEITPHHLCETVTPYLIREAKTSGIIFRAILSVIIVWMKADLSMALKGLLQEAFWNQTFANFDLKHSLCPTSAVVCISGVKDEQHQQINHLRDTTSRVYSYICMFRCEMCRSNGNRIKF